MAVAVVVSPTLMMSVVELPGHEPIESRVEVLHQSMTWLLPRLFKDFFTLTTDMARSPGVAMVALLESALKQSQAGWFLLS
jgi:hypothetical protein